MSKYGSNNSTVLGLNPDGTYDSIRYDVVKTTIGSRYNDLLSGNYQPDPIKLFIKLEPLKKAKSVEHRYRLISSVSLEDNFIDRIIFTPIFKKFLKNFRKTGLYVGYSPLKGGHLLINLMYNGAEPVLMIDKTAFDWTVQRQLLLIVRDFLIGCVDDPPKWWVDAVKQRFDHLFDKPWFVFSDGEKIQQPVEGVMKSGCFLTILINSILTILIHYITLLRMGLPIDDEILSLGDDALQRLMKQLPLYIQRMYTLGVLPKYEVSTTPCFAGFKYGFLSFQPEYLQKHLFALLHLDEDKEIAGMTLSSYLLIYWKNAEMLKYIRQLMDLKDLRSWDIRDSVLHDFNMGLIESF